MCSAVSACIGIHITGVQTWVWDQTAYMYMHQISELDRTMYCHKFYIWNNALQDAYIARLAASH